MIRYAIAEGNSSFDGLIIPVFEDAKVDTQVKDLNAVHGGLFETVRTLEDFEGKKGQKTLLYTNDTDVPRILLVGLGKKKSLTIRTWKQALGAGVIAMQSKKITKLGCVIPSVVCALFDTKSLAQESLLAIELANYAFDEYKQEDAQVTPLKDVHFVFELDKRAQKQWEKGIEKGVAIAQGTNFTRRLGNIPPTVMTPALLGKEAKKLEKISDKLKVEVLGESQIKKLGMGCFLGVAQASAHEPKFIILEYNGGKENQKPTVLAGKGITFDSGGLSIKPGNYMVDMKFDMLGAATVLGTIKAAALLGLKKNIVGLVPTCENAIAGDAYRPDDILIASNGKSVLIGNTDAEGRLILADALCYAKRYEPKEVIDFATLTGACLVAIGQERSGLFSEEEKIVNKLLESSQKVGEQLWRLPLGEEYSEAMKTEVADICNISNSRYGGASTAAAFLQFFTDYPWAHIDLSCSHYAGKGKPHIRGGANGFGVQTMVEYLS